MDSGMSLADTDFALFGLPERFGVDLGHLESQWKSLQAAAHPDRFATESAAAQRLAMQWATRINEAYRRLKNPLARGAYLCALRGVDVGAENNTAMPTDFLMQQMAWRESLAEAATLEEVEALADAVARSRSERLRALEAAIDSGVPVDWQAVAAQVRALMFVDRFRGDVDRRLDALQS